MYQCRFFICKKCIIWVGNVDNGRGHAYVGAAGLREIFALSVKFCYEL